MKYHLQKETRPRNSCVRLSTLLLRPAPSHERLSHRHKLNCLINQAHQSCTTKSIYQDFKNVPRENEFDIYFSENEKIRCCIETVLKKSCLIERNVPTRITCTRSR